MNATALDAALAVETPEGILLALRPAGFHARLNAWLLDALMRAGLLYIVMIATAFLGGLGMSFWLLALFLFEWFYPVAFELSPLGATPGKRLMGLRVVMDDGLPLTPAASLTRNLLRAADFLPVCYGLAVVCMHVRADFKRLGDVVASTLVIHVGQPPLPGYVDGIVPQAPAVPLPAAVRPALMALAARARQITPARMDEIAAIAAPLCGLQGVAGPELTRRVLAISLWLLGART